MKIQVLIRAKLRETNNSIEINTYEGDILQIDCNKAERELKTTPWSQLYYFADTVSP